MKGDIYCLIRKSDGRVIARFEQTEEYMSGHCYIGDGAGYDSGDDYFAHVFCKWDSCTHWWFEGERSFVDENNKVKNNDAYYHLCGSEWFINHIRVMCFIWKLAADILSEDEVYKEYVLSEYFDTDEIKKLVELMLDGYEIEKEK